MLVLIFLTSDNKFGVLLGSWLSELAVRHEIVLKAENMAEKLEWMAKLRSCIEATSRGDSIKGGAEFDSSRRFTSVPETSMVWSSRTLHLMLSLYFLR